jgi:hypothetical protein
MIDEPTAPTTATERGTDRSFMGLTRKMNAPAQAPASMMRRASATLA